MLGVLSPTRGMAMSCSVFCMDKMIIGGLLTLPAGPSPTARSLHEVYTGDLWVSDSRAMGPCISDHSSTEQVETTKDQTSRVEVG